MSSKAQTDTGMLFLVRQCSTANDERNYPLLLGRSIPQGLSQKGQQQAQALGEHFAGRDVSALYTSAASAAVQTARAIRGDRGMSITFCSSLMEANFGNWEGKTLDQVVRSDHHSAFLNGEGFPGGETFKQVRRRVLGYVEQLAHSLNGRRIAVISHEWALRVAICQLCGVTFDRVREIEIDPGKISLVRVFRGHLELKAVNYDLEFMEEAEECDTHSITQ